MPFRNSRIILVLACAFSIALVAVCLTVLGKPSNSNREQTWLLQQSLRPLGTTAYPSRLPPKNNESKSEYRSIETQIRDGNAGVKETHLLLKQGTDTLWDRVVCTSTFPVAQSIFYAPDFSCIVCALYTGSLLKADGNRITLLPTVTETGDKRDGPPFLSEWEVTGSSLGGTNIGSAIFGADGTVRDVNMNELLLHRVDYGWFPNIRISEAETELYISCEGIASPSENHSNTSGFEKYRISSTSRVALVNVHQINTEEMILLVTFRETLNYNGEQILSSQLNRIDFDQFDESGLAVLCLDRHGNLKWHGLLGPIHDSSDCTGSYSHLTLSNELLIYAAYNDDLFYSHTPADPLKLPLTPPRLLSGNANVFLSLTALSVSGDIRYSAKLAEGFLWGPEILSLSERQIYLTARTGNYVHFDAIERNDSNIGGMESQIHCILAIP